MATPISQLTIMNDFLFGVVMRDEKYCKPLLEYILKIRIKKIVYINDQETVQTSIPDAKSVRLDVYVEDDEHTVYDIEVQTTDKRNLGKRTRYYQSMIDTHALEKGDDYKKLKKSFVIFICNYDPYWKDRYIYTFQSRCDEDSTVLLKDDATKIIINTKGNVGEINDELKAVIDYMNTGIATTEYTKALDHQVDSAKADKNVRRDYMILMEALAHERSIGEYKRIVRQVRKKYSILSFAEMADLFDIAETDCKKVVAAITDHPDWNDEQIAEEIDWEA